MKVTSLTVRAEEYARHEVRRRGESVLDAWYLLCEEAPERPAAIHRYHVWVRRRLNAMLDVPGFRDVTDDWTSGEKRVRRALRRALPEALGEWYAENLPAIMELDGLYEVHRS